MKWLITGGAGFIGSHFIKYALQKGIQVVNVDALTYAGHAENLSDIEKFFPTQRNFMRGRQFQYEFVHADISDENAMERVFRRHSNINAVVNFAAESHVDRSLEKADVFLNSNVIGTRVLLEGARFCNARYLQVSTDEVYGSLDESGTFTEESAIDPSSPYSASKAAADLLVQAYVRSHGVDGIITRCSNNFGSHQDPEKLIPNSIISALNGKRIPIYGDGKNVRDWLHVYDHCVAIDFALWYGKKGHVYNIGGGNESSNLETVAIILDELKIDPDIIEFVEDRPGHDRRYAIDASKMRALGWRPQSEFEKELRNTVRWYAENRAWWEKIIDERERNTDYEENKIETGEAEKSERAAIGGGTKKPTEAKEREKSLEAGGEEKPTEAKEMEKPIEDRGTENLAEKASEIENQIAADEKTAGEGKNLANYHEKEKEDAVEITEKAVETVMKTVEKAEKITEKAVETKVETAEKAEEITEKPKKIVNSSDSKENANARDILEILTGGIFED